MVVPVAAVIVSVQRRSSDLAKPNNITQTSVKNEDSAETQLADRKPGMCAHGRMVNGSTTGQGEFLRACLSPTGC